MKPLHKDLIWLAIVIGTTVIGIRESRAKAQTIEALRVEMGTAPEDLDACVDLVVDCEGDSEKALEEERAVFELCAQDLKKADKAVLQCRMDKDEAWNALRYDVPEDREGGS